MRENYVKSLFEYNWTIREKWFEWCKRISEEELLKERIGGYKGILHTLFHIVDFEQRWMHGLSKEDPKKYNFQEYNSLDAVSKLSKMTKEYSLSFIEHSNWNLRNERFHGVNKQGEKVSFAYLEVLLHVSVHEVHHIGQLSVWAREMGKEPISANLIGLNLFV
ncbi:damage-inducible protein DinB [Robertmurraya yapensis]|uniref:Damage-inducible protein DinB n=1 Tax=Bacillus yapensis TaxID=2492960 RepID=A0A3S0KQV4_9BACI|nr:DinB family protein [Bacillus yapensis]RTR36189.1 damage-inducible protein DinB [Bacillus yapensis]TKT05692.1 damage-inducible protein DinB [Bacillus yapensis]